jgi:hypothetical protein
MRSMITDAQPAEEDYCIDGEAKQIRVKVVNSWKRDAEMSKVLKKCESIWRQGFYGRRPTIATLV